MGVVRSHSDDEASMVEVEFHNTSTHHSFSLPNPSGYSMAALSEQALVLATEKQDEQSRLVSLQIDDHFTFIAWYTDRTESIFCAFFIPGFCCYLISSASIIVV